ncbi:MAG: nuclear transport factor 2 family protein [Actinomycetota bacterium]
MASGRPTQHDPNIELATRLFAAWSSGDVDAPGAFLHPDAVLYDIVGGEHRGWPSIREFFGSGLKVWRDLVLAPEQFWTNDDGVAVNWVMSATVPESMATAFGSHNVGKKWRSEGMSWLRIADGKVLREVDYHDSGAARRSLD